MVILSWQRPDGLLKGVNVLYQDEWGIKDCYGTDEMEMERWTELVESMEEQGFGSFKVPLAYCRALITEALSTSISICAPPCKSRPSTIGRTGMKDGR